MTCLQLLVLIFLGRAGKVKLEDLKWLRQQLDVVWIQAIYMQSMHLWSAVLLLLLLLLLLPLLMVLHVECVRLKTNSCCCMGRFGRTVLVGVF